MEGSSQKDTSRHYKIQKLMAERIEAECRAKVEGQCPQVSEEGNHVRGTVSKVQCKCGRWRWDDGTKCMLCGRRYMSPKSSAAELEEDSLT